MRALQKVVSMHRALNPLLTGFVAKGSRTSGPKLNGPCLVNGKYCSNGENIGDY